MPAARFDLRTMLGITLGLALLPVLAATAFPQNIQNDTQTPAGTRSIIVNVLDRNGTPIRDLTKDNFVARIDGKPVAVLDAQYSVAPRRIVVLLDVNANMAREKAKWQIACGAVEGLLDQTPSSVPIAMMTFAGGVRDTFDFAHGRPAISNWINQASSREQSGGYYGKKALYDSVLRALELLNPPQSGDAIYVITDSGDYGSQATASSTEDALLESGTRLFGFLLVEPRDTYAALNNNVFLKVVQDTGGFAVGVFGQHRSGGATNDYDYVYDKGNHQKVSTASEQLSVQTQCFWTLQLAALPASSQEATFALDIVDAGGKATKSKNLVLTYPRLLAATK